MSTTLAEERPKTPQAVFDHVASYYDTLNSILSLGFDRRWRRHAAASLGLRPGARVLDVATGTGALAAEIARATAGAVSITACDLNEQMLLVARERPALTRAHVEILRCDATRLPFPDASFDAVTIAFAIDDMPDRDACAREMWRVLRPEGKLALLELGQPDAALLRRAYRVYLSTFRRLGDLSVRGYDHLEDEIRKYRGAAAVEALLLRSGFTGYRTTSLTWGIARLHTAEKPETTSGAEEVR
jgi:demethylmenaquinone methyltransferase/2-methoxy-6-polyprenyl-1,4-benzoquinol methylase